MIYTIVVKEIWNYKVEANSLEEAKATYGDAYSESNKLNTELISVDIKDTEPNPLHESCISCSAMFDMAFHDYTCPICSCEN